MIIIRLLLLRGLTSKSLHIKLWSEFSNIKYNILYYAALILFSEKAFKIGSKEQKLHLHSSIRNTHP